MQKKIEKANGALVDNEIEIEEEMPETKVVQNEIQNRINEMDKMYFIIEDSIIESIQDTLLMRANQTTPLKCLNRMGHFLLLFLQRLRLKC